MPFCSIRSCRPPAVTQIAARARVGRRNELERRREGQCRARPGHGHRPVLERLPQPQANAEARALVGQLKKALADLFRDRGASHLQVAKAYHYHDALRAEPLALIQALKAVVPPLVLIVLVLGSILTGVATPTESSSVGVIWAILLQRDGQASRAVTPR